MAKKAILDRIARFFKILYLKLFRINDTPEKVALGFGIGVFSGVLPGTGPIAALFLAFVFRANRASALLGSIITNTWLSIPVFLLALKTGAVLTGLHYRDIQAQFDLFLKDFRWGHLLNMSVYKILGPMLAGYFAVAACIGLMCYIVSLVAIRYFRKPKR